MEVNGLNSDLPNVMNYLNSLCYNNLLPLSTEEYIVEKLKLVTRYHPEKPRKKDAEKDVGLNLGVKALGKIPGKTKEKLEDLQKRANELYNARIETYELDVQRYEAEYQQKRKERETTLRNNVLALSKGSHVAASKYFGYALARDDYSVDAKHRFFPDYSELSFNHLDGSIQLSYRIPNTNEIPIIAKYEYNEKKDSIDPCFYDSKTSAKLRLQIAESVLLRAAAVIFLSDEFDLVKSISITGFIRYYDSAFGNDQSKNVIRITITKDHFGKINIEKVSPYDLFDRGLKAKISSGLYAKEPYEISDID